MKIETIYSVITIDTNYTDWFVESFEDYNEAVKYIRKELKDRGENYTKTEIVEMLEELGVISICDFEIRLEKGNLRKKK